MALKVCLTISIPKLGVASHLINKRTQIPATTIVELSIIRRVHPSIYKSNFLTIIPPQTAPIIAAGTITPPINILDFELEI